LYSIYSIQQSAATILMSKTATSWIKSAPKQLLFWAAMFLLLLCTVVKKADNIYFSTESTISKSTNQQPQINGVSNRMDFPLGYEGKEEESSEQEEEENKEQSKKQAKQIEPFALLQYCAAVLLSHQQEPIEEKIILVQTAQGSWFVIPKYILYKQYKFQLV
jgi:hypothetical protein